MKPKARVYGAVERPDSSEEISTLQPGNFISRGTRVRVYKRDTFIRMCRGTVEEVRFLAAWETSARIFFLFLLFFLCFSLFFFFTSVAHFCSVSSRVTINWRNMYTRSGRCIGCKGIGTTGVRDIPERIIPCSVHALIFREI